MSRLTRRQFTTTTALALAGTTLPTVRNAAAESTAGGGIIGLTGAAGHLGRLVIDELLRAVPASKIVAIARNRQHQTADLAAKGVVVRFGDYDYPETLHHAFTGIDRLLFISSNSSHRVPQHRAVIAAAKERAIGFVAYVSLLHATTSSLGALYNSYPATELMLAQSGVPHAILRNGWYLENYDIATAIQTGKFIGAAGNGRISAAARADYAAAAAAVLVAKDNQVGRVYELAGDDAFTMSAFAAEVARQSGKPVVYRDLSRAELEAALIAEGVPPADAALSAAEDNGIARDDLFDNGRQLSRLIGRPTTPWAQIIAATLKTLRD